MSAEKSNITLLSRRMAKRKYARYPIIFGELDLMGLIKIARDKGMLIIAASKPGMHICAEIGLYGEPQAMKETEREWELRGHTLRSAREKGLVFGVNLKRPKREWEENYFKEGEQK